MGEEEKEVIRGMEEDMVREQSCQHRLVDWVQALEWRLGPHIGRPDPDVPEDGVGIVGTDRTRGVAV